MLTLTYFSCIIFAGPYFIYKATIQGKAHQSKKGRKKEKKENNVCFICVKCYPKKSLNRWINKIDIDIPHFIFSWWNSKGQQRKNNSNQMEFIKTASDGAIVCSWKTSNKTNYIQLVLNTRFLNRDNNPLLRSPMCSHSIFPSTKKYTHP